MAKREGRRVTQELSLRLAPLALEGRNGEWLFSVACALALAAVALVDIATPRDITLGSIDLILVMAAGWLVGRRPLLAVMAFAVVTRIVAMWAGGVAVPTALFQSLILPVGAVIARIAAVNLRAWRNVARRSALAFDVAHIASSGESLTEVLDKILVRMAEDGLRDGTILRFDERDQMYVAASAGGLGHAVESREPEGRLLEQLAREGGPATTVDLAASIPPAEPPVSQPPERPLRALMAAPILSAGRSIGAVAVASEAPAAFSRDDLAALDQIAVAVSGAVQRAGALQLADSSLKQRVGELSVLLNTARDLSTSFELEVILQQICRAAAEVIISGPPRDRRAWVIRVEGDEGMVLGAHDPGLSNLTGLRFPLHEHPPMLAAYRSNVPQVGPWKELDAQIANHPRSPAGPRGAFASIRVRGEAYGLLVATSSVDHFFDEAELRLLSGVADLAGLAIGNAESFQQLREHGARMEQLERIKSEFMRLASHELRGPLAVIRGYAALLGDGSLGELPSPASAVLPVLEAKLTEMNMLIDQLLETARLEDDRLSLRREPFDLRDAIEQAVAAVTAAASPAHRLVFEPPREPITVVGDPARVTTIVTNLLDNAVKYSPDGGEVRVQLRPAGEIILIEVSDEGIGIAPADVPRLFTRFGRLVTPANSHIPGTGLGLYLSRELARLHGGDIHARSVEGRGSTFTLELPLHASDVPVAAQARTV